MDGSSFGSHTSGLTSDEVFDENLYLERIFETFVCPLTKQIMKDPVTLENGQTFEREAIEKWFEECASNEKEIICPVTMKGLRSTDLSSNVALKKTIQEWDLRNEQAKLRVARSTLSSGSSVGEVIKVLDYVEHLHEKGGSYRHVVRRADAISAITELLRNSSRSIRCRALEVLCLLAEVDRNKEVVADGDTLRTIVKFLYHELPQEKDLAVKLLLELSKSETICRRIGEINGAILILIGIASSSTENVVTMQNTEKTLENLEKCTTNVLEMAKNGRLQPLLRLFMEGSPETQMSMLSHLGDLVLSNEAKLLAARTAGPSLVKLMRSEDMVAKEASLRALNTISSYELSAMLLMESGILPPLMEDLFAIGNKQIPVRLMVFSATILSDLVSSGSGFESITLGNEAKTLVSEEVVHNLLQLISNTSPAVGSKLLQVLVGLTSSPTTAQHVVDAIKKTGAIMSLIQFVEVADSEIHLEVLKVLLNITPFLRRDLAKVLCGSAPLSRLIMIASEADEISEEKAFAIGILSELPDDDRDLIQCFLEDPLFQTLPAKLIQMHRGRILGSRLSIRYFEGLARVISKITYSLSYPPSIVFAVDNELALIFADLLLTNGVDNVQIVSAKALKNLSQHSRRLSRIPNQRKSGFFGKLCPCLGKNEPVVTGLCKVHSGVCTLKETFCLVEGSVTERLVACLDHANENLIEAALAALCTLLEDGLRIEQGASVLADAKAVMPIIQILTSRKAGAAHRQALWATERLLRTESIALEVFRNSAVRPVLIDAYSSGDDRTRQIAERALKWIEILPNFSRIF